MNKKGFTLIELLVVIAIIGILSSIVLVSLNSARSKGKDASAIASMESVRAAAELYYNSAGGNTYGSVGVWNGTPTPNAAPSLCNDPTTVAPLLAAAQAQTGVVAQCAVGAPTGVTTGTAYVAFAQLNAANSWFCVDSSGAATTTNILPTTGTFCRGGALQ